MLFMCTLSIPLLVLFMCTLSIPLLMLFMDEEVSDITAGVVAT
jgi:hypothetical protein